MTISNFSFLDTDIQLFRLDPDPAIREAAKLEFEAKFKCAMSSFSLVELKGNYISCLILLRRKIEDSESLEESYAKIRSSGGRKSAMMLAQLFRWLGGMDFPINPWIEAQRHILVVIDAQIINAWEEFKNNVGRIFDDLQCERAAEDPIVERGKWSARIPKCRSDNTGCKIVQFIRSFQKELVDLINHLGAALLRRP